MLFAFIPQCYSPPNQRGNGMLISAVMPLYWRGALNAWLSIKVYESLSDTYHYQ